MREVLADIEQWLAEQQPVALATVVQTWGSAPRREGAKMAFTPAGQLSGSVSGGCVEGAVYEAGLEALENKQPQLLHFGVADETAWEVGLACGGEIRVFVEPLDSQVQALAQETAQAEQAGAAVTVISGPAALLGRKLIVREGEVVYGSILPAVDEQAVALVEAQIRQGKPGRVTVEAAEEPAELFIDVWMPAPQLVMVGAVHIAIALAQMATTLGYRTIVIDPRRAFGSEERFPHVDRLIQGWPDKALAEVSLNPSTAVVMLTHDPKIDDVALKIVLDKPVFYIGALGSSRTHAKRRERLLAAGIPAEKLERIHAPIGLDIGAQTPEEIAVAVLAEIVAARHASA